MVKLRVTLVWEYEADPSHYSSDNPNEMAREDQDSFINNHDAALEIVEWDIPKSVTVEVVG